MHFACVTSSREPHRDAVCQRSETAPPLQLQQAVTTDLDERVEQTAEATLLCSQYAQRLYGQGRGACLAFGAGPNSLQIHPHLRSDDSRAISSMVIFCFDLTLAVLAHRHGCGHASSSTTATSSTASTTANSPPPSNSPPTSPAKKMLPMSVNLTCPIAATTADTE